MSDYRRLFDLRLGGRAHVDAEMDQEIEAHIAMRAADLERAGMAPDAARREAERRFGNLDRARRRLHDAARQRQAALQHRDRIGSLIADIRYAARQAYRAPGFTALSILMLAIGIGATTTIFTLVERVLVRPLPFPASEQLVQLYARDSAGNYAPHVSAADWRDWSAARSLTSSAIYYRPFRSTVFVGDSAIRVDATETSSDFFKVLRARFVVGRPFSQADITEGASAVVISERLWRSALGGDASLSRPLRLPSGNRTVIGVVADGQSYPAHLDLWTSARIPTRTGDARNWTNYFAIARLATDTTTANTELTTIARGVHAQDPVALYDWGVRAAPLASAIAGDASTYLKMLMGAVSLVLLIVCANIAASGLARGATRAREMAVRTSLGAGRARLVQQLLVEHACLGLAGGTLGFAFAWAGTRVIVAKWGSKIPRANEIGVDLTILGFAVLASLLAGVVAGVLPAIRGSRVRLTSMLSNGSRTAARGGRNIAGASLVSLEIALAVLLLTGAGLLIRSFRSVLSRDIGFDTNVATVAVSLTGPRYDRDSVARYAYWDGLLDAVRRVPGVEAAAVSQWIPLGMTGAGFIDIMGRENQRATAVYRSVSSDFFRALRVPLVTGRSFDAGDGATTPRVVVINQTMAKRYWPGENPIGKQVRARSMELRFDGKPAPWLTVIGVVGDVRTYGLEKEANAEMYVYFRQTPGWTSGMTALVRGSRPAPKMLAELRRAAATVDRGVAVDLGTLDDLLDGTLASRTLAMSLLTAFAGIALILAALGVYGVLSYAVAQRTRELAVRAALGAQRRQLMGMVLLEGGRVVIIGAGIGIAAAFWLTSALESMLVDVTAIDPPTFAMSVAVLLGASFTAVLVPSLRATRLDPMIALQAE